VDRDERLALVVRVKVAQIRAKQAEDRAAFLDRRCQPLIDALEEFEALHAREPDLESDLDEVMRIAVQLGGGEIDRATIAAAAAAAEEASAWQLTASEAIAELARALDDGQTVSDWLEVDDALVDLIVERTLQMMEH
jgi:hypothetical protein